jgi:Na+-driven multidrug efflux pump
MMAAAVLGGLGLLLAVTPDLWSRHFTPDAEVRRAAGLYFLWAGPSYGLFGLGQCLYFSSLGAGKVIGPVLAGTLRLVLVAAGGALLAAVQAPAWTVFALVALGMAVYGVATGLFVHRTRWGADA